MMHALEGEDMHKMKGETRMRGNVATPRADLDYRPLDRRAGAQRAMHSAQYPTVMDRSGSPPRSPPPR